VRGIRRVAAILAGTALGGPGTLPAVPDPGEVAAGILRHVDAAREEAGVPPLRREPLLEEAASRRAREVASRPEGRRFAYDEPIDTYVREGGLRRFARAAQYVSTQGGYEDPVASAIANWRAYEDGWRIALDPAWSAAAVATTRTEDDLLVIVAVFLEDETPLPTPEAMERAAWEATNGERRIRGLAALAWDDALAEVARTHSRDMADRSYLGHESPEGAGPADRVRAAGIAYRALAENVARNLHMEEPVAAAVAGWIESRPHRKNLLSPEFTRTGIGVVIDDEGRVIFTQLLLLPPPERANDDGGQP
jgi:uncharacterized protein YkwD